MNIVIFVWFIGNDVIGTDKTNSSLNLWCSAPKKVFKNVNHFRYSKVKRSALREVFSSYIPMVTFTASGEGRKVDRVSRGLSVIIDPQ